MESPTSNPNHFPSFSFPLFIFTIAMPYLPSSSSFPLLDFLQELQSTALRTLGPSRFDPKLYVDLPLRSDLDSTRSAFLRLARLPNGSVPVDDLQRFVATHFEDAGSDLVNHEPSDFVAEPVGFLPLVENREVREWALDVHALWKELSRKESERVSEEPDRHTLLPLPEPVIVPGSRFREVYYWDSYWVIRGLLTSKMNKTAKAIVNNLISMVESYGFVLNGARSYYTNRSQPPLLSSMVMEIYQKTGDLDLVKKAFPHLLKEHEFWNSKIHKVIIQDAHGRNHTLNRYYTMWNQPRPESATIDEESASKISSDDEKEHFYLELASTAESGWDFSSRWMSDPSCLTTLMTTSIVPVDLNTFILKMELDLAHFARVLGETSTAETLETASKSRVQAINSICWNEEMNQWLDYWLSDAQKEFHTWQGNNQNRKIFASNFVPVWVHALSAGDKAEKAVKSLVTSGLIQRGGIATSLLNSGQQWDFPNGWAPLQHLIAEGLAKSKSEEAKTVAKDIVVRWLRNNYVSYKKTGHMHEKYDVRECGMAGGGGEYAPQTGFGWTNGVALSFLEEFGWPKDERMVCN